MLCEIGNIGSSCPTNHFSNVHELIFSPHAWLFSSSSSFPLSGCALPHILEASPHLLFLHFKLHRARVRRTPSRYIESVQTHRARVRSLLTRASDTTPRLLARYAELESNTERSHLAGYLPSEPSFARNWSSASMASYCRPLARIPRRIEVRPWDRHTWLRTTHHARTHWQRSARTGSTRVARSAGMKDADSATIVKRTATPAYVAKSVALTP